LLSTPFVGRERELVELQAGLEHALAGRGCLVLLAGEPGIGKTRLAEEFSIIARQLGARALWGRCWEGEGAPAFWPWVQVVRTSLQAYTPEGLAIDLGPGAADIARIVPEVRALLPASPPSPELEPAQARFRLFDSVTTFLKNIAHMQPLVLILDDLQWADKSSLLLLHFLARALHDARLLVIGTYRDTELRQGHPLAETLGGLVRESQSTVLHGLAEQDVARFIQITAGATPATSLVTAVHEKTEGNPFFVNEIVRLLATEGYLQDPKGLATLRVSIPAGVRETIRRRLARLPETCKNLLAAASVVGRDFGLELLAHLSPEIEHTYLLEQLTTALAAHIVDAVPGNVSRYRFVHALTRETLYEDLPFIERTRLHRQIGEALEQLHAVNFTPHLAELADHFFKATPGGAVDKALQYTVKAAEHATALLAYEEAAAYYERALQLLELTEANEVLRCELLLALGDAQLKAGETRKARGTFQQAAELARQLKAPEQLARAALGFAGRGDIATRFDQPLVSLLEEALAALLETDSPLRMRVLGRLAMALYFSSFTERRAELSLQAVEMARRLGGATTLAYALSARHFALWGPDNVAERLTIATEIIRLAEEAGRKELAIGGHFWRLLDLLELGDISALDRELQAYSLLAEELRQPFYLWRTTALRAMRALLAGRFEEGEQLIQEALTTGQQAQSPNAFLLFAVQIFGLRREQGRLQELEDALKGFVIRYPAIPAFRSGLAFLYSELGREVDARVEFEQLAATDFADLPRDGTWLNTLDELAQVCAFLGDTRRAARLYELLLPYARHNVVISFADACDGAVSRYLGLLATTMAHWEEATQHFEDALAMNARMGARPFVARTQYEYARMLLARGQRDDRERALALLEQALQTVQELGMMSLQSQVQSLKSKVEKSPESGVQSPESENQSSYPTTLQTLDARRQTPDAQHSALSTQHSNVFRRDGAYWTLAYAGVTARLKNTKGLRYLAHLLQHPGQESHVVDLLELTDKRPPVPRTPYATMPSEQLAEQHLHLAAAAETSVSPDTQARAIYRRRVKELRSELEEAEQFEDIGRIAKLQEEIHFLTNELQTAYSVGQHARRSNDSVEKVRKAVTNRIRAALAQIQKAHPVLWQHLFKAVRTGVFCAYQPETPISWRV
jgi:tetratricopeptide (TPR) repeat protein